MARDIIGASTNPGDEGSYVAGSLASTPDPVDPNKYSAEMRPEGETYGEQNTPPMWANILAGGFGRKASDYVRPQRMTTPEQDVMTSPYLKNLFIHAYLTGDVPTAVPTSPPGIIDRLGQALGLSEAPPPMRKLTNYEGYASKLGLIARHQLDVQTNEQRLKLEDERLTNLGKAELVDPERIKLERDKIQAAIDLNKKQAQGIDWLHEYHDKLLQHQNSLELGQKRLQLSILRGAVQPRITALQAQSKQIQSAILAAQKDPLSMINPEQIQTLITQKKQIDDETQRVQGLLLQETAGLGGMEGDMPDFFGTQTTPSEEQGVKPPPDELMGEQQTGQILPTTPQGNLFTNPFGTLWRMNPFVETPAY